MIRLFEYPKYENQAQVLAVLQQDVERFFPVRRRGSQNLPEFLANFQGKIFQSGFWIGELNENTFAWLLLGNF